MGSVLRLEQLRKELVNEVSTLASSLETEGFLLNKSRKATVMVLGIQRECLSYPNPSSSRFAFSLFSRYWRTRIEL
jgi:hypothetical protein